MLSTEAAPLNDGYALQFGRAPLVGSPTPMRPVAATPRAEATPHSSRSRGQGCSSRYSVSRYSVLFDSGCLRALVRAVDRFCRIGVWRSPRSAAAARRIGGGEPTRVPRPNWSAYPSFRGMAQGTTFSATWPGHPGRAPAPVQHGNPCGDSSAAFARFQRVEGPDVVDCGGDAGDEGQI